MATTATPRQHTDRPWHRRSELHARETEIRALVAEGYSLRQIVDRLGLAVHRSTLHRWLRRTSADAAVARPAGAPTPAATLTAPGAVDSTEAAHEDAAAEALLAATDFSPPSRK
jgi:transposase